MGFRNSYVFVGQIGHSAFEEIEELEHRHSPVDLSPL